MSCARSLTTLFVAATLVAALGLPCTHAQVLPHGLKVEKILDNTAELGNIVQAPTGELWVLERTGRIRVLTNGAETASLTVPVITTCQGGLMDAAFSIDYSVSGRAFIYYVDATNRARIDEVLRTASGLSLGTMLLDLGSAGDTCRPGGDLQVGKDGKVYVATGDCTVAPAAQDSGSNLGKVLRMNPDGTVPADNPSGTLVWAKGFRHPHGFAYNPDTARAGGTFYASDVGFAATANDEVNQVKVGANYGWANGSGNLGGSYTDPLMTWGSASLVNPMGITVLNRTQLGAKHEDSLAIAAPTNDAANKGKVLAMKLSGAELDTFSSSSTFFDPAGDLDGTPDTLCPTKVNVVEQVKDGELYLANTGDNKGIWRIWNDTPGPREVSATGSPFQLTIQKSGTSLRIGWENLGSLDAKRPTRFAAGQRAETYRVWQGSLPLTGTYDHTVLLSSNGAANGPARLEATVSPGGGNRYYLVSAQGDNLEGGVGAASNGTARPVAGTRDYCDTIGTAVGNNIGKCMKDFQKPASQGGGVLKLIDYNPVSPTYMQAVSLADFRGKVIRVDISAIDCFWCDKQAYCLPAREKTYGARDAEFITIMMKTYGRWDALAPADCASNIAAWQNTHKDTGPILCDVDLDGNGRADAAASISPGSCGTPENIYVDQGFVQYKYVCGAEEYQYGPITCSGAIGTSLAPEVNAESCE